MQLNLLALDRLLAACLDAEGSNGLTVTEHFRSDYGVGRSVSSADGFTRWRYAAYDRFVEPLGAAVCGSELSGSAWCNRRISIQPQLAWDAASRLGVRSVHWVRGFRRGWVDSQQQADWHESAEHVAGFEHAKVFAGIWPEYRLRGGEGNWQAGAISGWHQRQEQWLRFGRAQAEQERQQKLARNQQLSTVH